MGPIRTTLTALTLLIFLVGSAAPAWSWGDLGHTIVCEMAFQELNETARRAVLRLMRKDSEFRFFADACTWPDHPRKRASEHFINVPRDFDRFTAPQCPQAAECLLTAIKADLEVLRTSTDPVARLEALKFLGHWVGDLHQPLHVSFADDRGGNRIHEIGPCRDSLHSVWDSCILEREIGTQPREVAHDLLEEVTDSDRTRWLATPPEEWANESLAISRRASVEYCVFVGTTCRYEAGNGQFDEGETEKTVVVEAAYLQLHVPIVADRLKRAGVRLGDLLNRHLGQ